MGDEKYKAQSRLEKEQYVYDELMKNKEKLTDRQINHTKAYIFKEKMDIAQIEMN